MSAFLIFAAVALALAIATPLAFVLLTIAPFTQGESA
jgi:hypothetical protein